MPDDLLTRQETADLFRVDKATIRRWERAGRLPAITLPSGRPRYKRSDVEALIASFRGDAA